MGTHASFGPLMMTVALLVDLKSGKEKMPANASEVMELAKTFFKTSLFFSVCFLVAGFVGSIGINALSHYARRISAPLAFKAIGTGVKNIAHFANPLITVLGTVYLTRN